MSPGAASDRRSRIIRASAMFAPLHGGRVAIVALGRSQPDQRPQRLKDINAVFRMSRALGAVELEGTSVPRQPLGGPPKVHELLAEIVEVIGEVGSVAVNLLRLVDGQLLFGHGLLEGGERLGVFPGLVVQDTEVVPAQAELGVIEPLVGLRSDQGLEDVHGPPDRPEGLDVLMGPVLDGGDLATTQSKLHLVLGDGRV